MQKIKLNSLILLGVLLVFSACREDEVILRTQTTQVTYPNREASVVGFYQLNEGVMESNNASLDYFDCTAGVYASNIYSEANPNSIKELGDVGNDLKVYGNKVYAVINASNKVEVLDKHTGIREKVITIPNCRYITFNGGKAYVSSYAGPIQVDPNAEKGFVAEIDTVSLQITRKVGVGYQPEEMVVSGNKLYVANSGGYRVPNYDHTVSVVDLTSFQEIKKIDVAINLHRMIADKRGLIYVSSRGNYGSILSDTYVIDPTKDQVIEQLNLPASNFFLHDDMLYIHSSEWDASSASEKTSYRIYDTLNKKLISNNFIKDGTEKYIVKAYGIAVNPETNDILISDAQDYVVTGYIYCYSQEGYLKWKTKAGNIPGHFAFVYRDHIPMDNYNKGTL